MRILLATADLTVFPLTAAAAIKVDILACDSQQMVSIGTVALDGFDDTLRLTDFNRPSSEHIILRGDNGYGSWFTPAEAETACPCGEQMEIVRCFTDGSTVVDRYWMGDAMRFLGGPATAPEAG